MTRPSHPPHQFSIKPIELYSRILCISPWLFLPFFPVIVLVFSFMGIVPKHSQRLFPTKVAERKNLILSRNLKFSLILWQRPLWDWNSPFIFRNLSQRWWVSQEPLADIEKEKSLKRTVRNLWVEMISSSYKWCWYISQGWCVKRINYDKEYGETALSRGNNEEWLKDIIISRC